jgi:hypothetical protein
MLVNGQEQNLIKSKISSRAKPHQEQNLIKSKTSSRAKPHQEQNLIKRKTIIKGKTIIKIKRTEPSLKAKPYKNI